MTRQFLPDESVFRDGGHLADPALAAIADGHDELVPAAGHAHLEECDACTHRLGEAALLSLAAGEALALAAVAVAPSFAPESARSRRAPGVAILLGVLVAVLAALPRLVEAPEMLRSLRSFPTALPLIARNLVVVVRAVASALEGRAVVASLVVSVVLVVVGLMIARTTPALTGASS